MLIEVKETHPPPADNRSGTVITMDGQRLDCWPNMLNGIQVGQRYDVETSRREKNGRTYVSITKATPVSFDKGSGGAAPSPQQQSSGQVARGYFDEASFAGHGLAALILKGEVSWNPQNPRQVTEATRMLREIWRATSGN